MKKYFVILKANLMSNLLYMANIVSNAIGYFFYIFIYIQLWNYIYDDPEMLINGYSKSQMIWYVIITEIIICCVSGRKMVREICNDVRSGNVVNNINKPYSYVGYLLFNNLGRALLKAMVLAIVGFTMGVICLNGFPQITILKVVIFILSCFLAIIINLLLLSFIGLVAFIMEDSSPLYWIYSKILIIFGAALPVEFFPAFMQPLIMYTPVYVTCYGPAKVFIDFDVYSSISTIIAQLIYLVISYALCELMYRKGVKKINVNGG